ncbi:hypothetical protein [Vibrio sp. VPAP30]|uniref:hypothetical protein n=1 Tax=Vibrio sp. VPAP30 TaxID=1647102 RepID=UPI000A70BF88
MSSSYSFYKQNAEQLCAQYNSISDDYVHCSWQPYWSLPNNKVLDVGTGSG